MLQTTASGKPRILVRVILIVLRLKKDVMPAKHPNKRITGIIRFWLPVYVWMGIIFYFSSLPAEAIPHLFFYQDIFFHLFNYFLLVYFFSRAIKNTFYSLSFKKRVYFCIIFGIIYGLSDEFHQFFVPGRDMSMGDLLFDGLGSLLGSLFYQ
ncbi:MAG: VanZ family protein [Candidatus Omnitrophica bacterium]|nr:VanZ family protein [Candidatus Omnitrophota bacterium]